MEGIPRRKINQGLPNRQSCLGQEGTGVSRGVPRHCQTPAVFNDAEAILLKSSGEETMICW